jgi:hypothetical protein
VSAEQELAKLTEPQMLELLRLSLLYPESTWHMNACGCCCCLHPAGQRHNEDAYIINSDGDSSYITKDEL